MTPCLKKFCASAPAEDHARVRRTRAHARKNFAPGWAGAAGRVWFARVLKLSACCPGPAICWAVCGHGWRPGHGWEALPSGLCCCLGCAPCAWACMCACVCGRVSLPACCLVYACRRCPRLHPRRTTPRPEACPLPPIRGLPVVLPAPPACSPAGRRSCRPGPLRRWHMPAGGVLCARSGFLVV